jgi:hypothetical protein
MRDDEVIAAAADAGLALVFTGKALGRRRPLMTQSGHSLATKQRPPPSGKRDERREQVCPFPGPFLLRPLARRRCCRWHVGFRPTTLRDYVLRRQNSRPEQVAGDARAE